MKTFLPRHARHWRPLALALAVCGAVGKLALLGWLLSAWGPAQANEALSAGRALFLGQQPLPARLATQPAALPPAASRCINCHSAPGLASASAVPGGSASYGPALNSAWLLQLQARRGGPPSRYDAPRLCRLLREGVDPAGVMLPPAMPRYTLDDAQCRQLWTLLTSDL